MANFITIFRVFLIFIATFLLFIKTPGSYTAAIILTIIGFSLDGLDGYVARKLGESSKLGAMLDIMSDRIVENTLWVTFAVLGWIPLVFPIVSLTRGFVVDGIRSVAMANGFTAFGESSMQSSKLGAFICSSKFMRISYAVAKVVAFFLMMIAKFPGLDKDISTVFFVIAYLSAIFAILFCIIRGLPVIFESKELFRNAKG